MPDDWMEYLRHVADSRLLMARQAEPSLRANAFGLAVAEVHGAANALVAAGLLESRAANAFVADLQRTTGRELVDAGLAEAVHVSASASLTITPGRHSPTDGA